MKLGVRTCVFGLTMLVVAVPSVSAQTRERGGDRTSSIERRQPDTGQFQLLTVGGPAAAAVAKLYGRVVPSMQFTDAKSTFGASVHFVHDTKASNDGLGFATVLATYKAGVPRDGGGHSDAYRFAADVQLNKNSHAFGQFIVSGDVGGVKGVDRDMSAGLEWDFEANERSGTLVVTAALSRVLPNGGESVTDVIPGLEYDYDLTPNVTAIGEYTFKNDIDGEDDWAGTVRLGIGSQVALKVGIGKGIRVFLSLTRTVGKK